MIAKPKTALSMETQWLRAYARTYLPSDAAFSFSPERLRRAGVTLVDVRNVFRTGVVAVADKLDGPGALWIVEGENSNGDLLRLTVIVVSEELAVSLRDVERVIVKEDGQHDAA